MEPTRPATMAWTTEPRQQSSDKHWYDAGGGCSWACGETCMADYAPDPPPPPPSPCGVGG